MSVEIACRIIEEHRDDAGWLLECARRQAGRIEELNEEVSELRVRWEALRDENVRLRERLAEAERAGKRQAAPFRRGESKRKSDPRRPGRKPGHAGAHRPRPEVVDRREDVPLGCCPVCGAQEARQVKRVVQYIEEIPPMRPVVTELVTYEGTCLRCGVRYSSDHPLKVSSATGAAGTHLGPRALAVVAELNKHHGLSMRKTCGVMKSLFGLRLTPGGVSQALDRAAERLRSDYDGLVGELRNSAVAYADETSWWIGGPAWLWVFTTPGLTCYVVDETRARAVVRRTLGEGFGGVLVSDCLATYDNATAVQQKCYAHHLKAISEAMREHPEGGKGYLEEVRGLLVAAMAVGGMDRGSADLARYYEILNRRADALLGVAREQAQEEAVRRRLAKQRDHLFTFLEHEGVDATNNRAERQLRPAVLVRKVCCGNKTRRGADTFEVLASVAATCDQRGECFLARVEQAFRRGPPAARGSPTEQRTTASPQA